LAVRGHGFGALLEIDGAGACLISRNRNRVRKKLAKRALAKQTSGDFERGARSPSPRTLADIRAALEAEGVEFTNGDAPGVRLRPRR
jgi:hypothetical protein